MMLLPLPWKVTDVRGAAGKAVAVAEPASGVRRADRVHDLFTQDLRQRPAKDVQRRQRQHVLTRTSVYL